MPTPRRRRGELDRGDAGREHGDVAGDRGRGGGSDRVSLIFDLCGND